MGEQILTLAGCDRLTIAPKWLQAMTESKETVKKQLEDKGADSETVFTEKIEITESTYRYGMCQDACATEKLAEGIRKFAADIVKVEEILKPLFDKKIEQMIWKNDSFFYFTSNSSSL